MNRPPTPDTPVAPGFHWEAVPDDGPLHWTLSRPIRLVGIPTANRCRVVAGPDRHSCKRPAVAWLDRGRLRPQWFAYCEDHLFGRWIENGQVMRWRLASDSHKPITPERS